MLEYRQTDRHAHDNIPLPYWGEVNLIRTAVIGPISWGHSGPLCHALSLSSLSVVLDIDAQAARDSSDSDTC